MATPPSFAKRCSWRIEYLGYRLMIAAMKPLPLEFIDHAGSAAGRLLFHLSPHYRRLAIRNLRIAYGKEKSLEDIQVLARQTCERTFANFLGTLKTTILPTAEIDQHITLSGLTELTQTLEQGKGAILVLGHMGNWEILNRLHQYLPKGVPAGGIYQPLKNPLVNGHLLKLREQDGSVLFSKREGFHGPASFVKKGGLLIIVADQKVARSGIPIPFFNRISALSQLPSLLARKAGAPLFAAGIATSRPGHWHISFEHTPAADTETIIQALEAQIRNSPTDYLWLHNRWKLIKRHPLDLDVKKALPIPTHTTALQVLLLSEKATDLSVAQAFLAKRPATSLPLQFHHFDSTNNSSPESLAAQIQTFDHALCYPLQLIIVSTPNPNLEKAANLSGIPSVRCNQKQIPLEAFLAELSRAHS